MDAQTAFVSRQLIAPLEPPVIDTGVPAWLRQRLFSSVSNMILTLLSAIIIVALVWPAIKFMLIDAVWTGASREDCIAANVGREVGACWPFIAAKFGQFMYGFYPVDQQWRVNLTYAIGVILLVPLLIPRIPYKLLNAILFFGVFPVVSRSSCWWAAASGWSMCRPATGAGCS